MKSKAAKVSKTLSVTGGGHPSLTGLSSFEKLVFNMIHPAPVRGDQNARESRAPLLEDEDEEQEEEEIDFTHDEEYFTANEDAGFLVCIRVFRYGESF